ncbi:alkaline phosphatase family protein [Patescibacteria group bacterium]|nr:alkaline phosphatase family protein [Patescibacteria group bacterium]MBU1868565.1 alkaline phosphatase family protein [Patescibacteria group bacterium]
MSLEKKLIIIGIDGVPRNLLERLIELELLPNIREIVKKGVLSDLESTNPPLTGPAWISLVTGQSPTEHGCFGFTLPTSRLEKRLSKDNWRIIFRCAS